MKKTNQELENEIQDLKKTVYDLEKEKEKLFKTNTVIPIPEYDHYQKLKEKEYYYTERINKLEMINYKLMQSCADLSTSIERITKRQSE